LNVTKSEISGYIYSEYDDDDDDGDCLMEFFTVVSYKLMEISNVLTASIIREL
jgi:hypothetical protein